MLNITAVDDTRATINWDNDSIKPQHEEYPFTNVMDAVIDGDLMTTYDGDCTLVLSGDKIIVTLSESNIYASSVSGIYVPDR